MAVRELLRVADVLSNALKIVNNNSEGIESDLDYVANEQVEIRSHDEHYTHAVNNSLLTTD